MALNVMALCNQYQKPIVIEGDEGVRIVAADLPVMQEKAFNMACLYVGAYFEKRLREETHE